MLSVTISEGATKHSQIYSQKYVKLLFTFAQMPPLNQSHNLENWVIGICVSHSNLGYYRSSWKLEHTLILFHILIGFSPRQHFLWELVHRMVTHWGTSLLFLVASDSQGSKLCVLIIIKEPELLNKPVFD